MAGLANRPYPPGNLKINNHYFPVGVTGPVSLSWASRNRLQQTGGEFIGFQDVSVIAEEGTSYSIYVYNDTSNELKYIANGITTLSHAIGIGDLSGITTLRIEVFSVRDGFTSHQAQKHIMDWSSGENVMVFEEGYTPDIGDQVVLQFTELG
ncbi:hypothetical protein D3C72_243030 [compost metagenome]